MHAKHYIFSLYANYIMPIIMFILLDDILHLNEPGDPPWMTREEYIMFGAQRLASCDSTIKEG